MRSANCAPEGTLPWVIDPEVPMRVRNFDGLMMMDDWRERWYVRRMSRALRTPSITDRTENRSGCNGERGEEHKQAASHLPQYTDRV